VILACVFLLLQPADPGPIHAHQHKEVFCVKTHRLVTRDDLHVRQPLLVGADLILTFGDKHAFLFQDSVRLAACLDVHIHYGVMPFWSIFVRRFSV
jgi:hypothetical protein